MRDEIFRFTGSPECREAIEAAELRDPISVERRDAGGVRMIDGAGRLIAKVTMRHMFARFLEDQQHLHLYFSVNSATPPCSQYPNGKVHIRASILPTEDRGAAHGYPVAIVGESFYQAAIRRCHEGERVVLWHEFNNPHDAQAIVVKTANGERIGHIGRHHWLMDAIHRDGKGISASILSLHTKHDIIGVVLHISLDGAPVEKSSYDDSASPPLGCSADAMKAFRRGSRKGWLAWLLGR